VNTFIGRSTHAARESNMHRRAHTITNAKTMLGKFSNRVLSLREIYRLELTSNYVRLRPSPKRTIVLIVTTRKLMRKHFLRN
jgi:hypothetical protein